MEGLEQILADELQDLNLSNIKILRRAVSCEGNVSQLYRCNYQLRTALRVLVPMVSFEAFDEEELYDACRSIEWDRFMTHKTSFAIDSTVSGNVFKHSQYVIYKIKDAIVDQFRENGFDRPNINTKNPDIRFNVHVRENEISILLDSSGKSLHLRNYKIRNYKAPVNEVLAAGLIKLTGWDHAKTFHDPMCGSGTFVTEALMQAGNIPAGKYIEKFAFQKWPDFQREIWQAVKSAADNAIINPDVEIVASDLSAYAVRDVKKNLQKFPFKEKVKTYQRDFFKTHGNPNSILIMNPPYDKRVSVDNIYEFYSNIGNALKQFWKGSEAWVLSGNSDAMKKFGLRPSVKHPIYNGGIESKFYKFELYEGSKKSKYNNPRRNFNGPRQ